MQIDVFSWEDKLAPVSEEIHPLIRQRFSARSFRPESLTEEQMKCLIEAAVWSSSSMNEQPWRYAFALRSEPEKFEKFLNCLLPGNKSWAKNAGAFILSLAYNWHDSINAANPFAWHDTGAANTSLLLQATHMGLSGRMMGGFDLQITAETFGLTQDAPNLDAPMLSPVCFIALGYPDAPGRLHEPFRSRELVPRERKPWTDSLIDL